MRCDFFWLCCASICILERDRLRDRNVRKRARANSCTGEGESYFCEASRSDEGDQKGRWLCVAPSPGCKLARGGGGARLVRVSAPHLADVKSV
jgi:hypothetical protein